VLLDIGPKVTRIGGNGLAVQTKIAINLALVVQVIAFCEGVALAEQGGVDRQAVVDAMRGSVIWSPVLDYRGPFILEGQMPEEALADVSLQQKDMLLALDAGRTLGSPVPLTAVANEMLNAARGLGIDGNDFVVVHRVYRALAGAGE
jgi:3-hydroxyisobutyrate dehydrogenase-like beta-hydroxyacid dehydrogenase